MIFEKESYKGFVFLCPIIIFQLSHHGASKRKDCQMFGLDSGVNFDKINENWDINLRSIVMHFRAVTLSGEVGSGKSSIARELGILLPEWRLVNTGQRFRDFCALKGMSIQQVAQLPDEVHQEFDMAQRDLLATETNIIIEGRLAGWLSRNFEDVFRIWCDAPIDVRANRLGAREGISFEQALIDLHQRDQGDLEKYQRIYALPDYRDPVFYHLHLDTAQFLPDELAKIAAQAAGFDARIRPACS
jgi:CMP/dCMP kinase